MNSQNILDVWYKEHYSTLWLNAKKTIGDNQAAEDVVQNTFISAWKSLEKYDHNYSPVYWLLSILRRRAIDYKRRNYGVNGIKKQVSIQDVEPSYFEKNINKDIPKNLQNAINKLNEDIKKTFLMLVLEEYTHQEVAIKLNIPIGTVLSRVSRAKKHIKKHLEKNGN